MDRPTKESCVNVLLAGATFLLCLLILEATLALFWPHKILDQPYHEQYHPVMGWVNKPNADSDFYFGRKAMFHRHHNGHGLRSLREIPYEKPAGVRRVLLVGDSFFWGYGVNDAEVLSEILQKKVGSDIEIINGAVSGYGTDQELLWLTEEGLKYSPDLVVLGFFPNNDWDEISHSINYGFPKPYFSLDGKNLVLHNVPVPDTRETRRKVFENPESFLGRAKKFLRHNTHTYPFLARRLNALPGLRPLLISLGLADEFTRSFPGVPSLTLKPELIQPLSEALLREIIRVSHEAGADFLLVFIPEKENTSNTPIHYEGARDVAEDWNSRSSEYLTRLTTENGISYLDLLPLFRSAHQCGEALHNPHAYDHHWNAAGHRLAADALFDWIKEKWRPVGDAQTPPPSGHP